MTDLEAMKAHAELEMAEFQRVDGPSFQDIYATMVSRSTDLQGTTISCQGDLLCLLRGQLAAARAALSACRVSLQEKLRSRDKVFLMMIKAFAERDVALAELATAREVIDRDTVLIRDQAASIAALRAAAVFKAPAAVKSRLKSNPFREFPGDHRRIGGCGNGLPPAFGA